MYSYIASQELVTLLFLLLCYKGLYAHDRPAKIEETRLGELS